MFDVETVQRDSNLWRKKTNPQATAKTSNVVVE